MRKGRNSSLCDNNNNNKKFIFYLKISKELRAREKKEKRMLILSNVSEVFYLKIFLSSFLF